jgi:hypothetical protein
MAQKKGARPASKRAVARAPSSPSATGGVVVPAAPPASDAPVAADTTSPAAALSTVVVVPTPTVVPLDPEKTGGDGGWMSAAPDCPHCGHPLEKHANEHGPKAGAWHCAGCGCCMVHRGSRWFNREGHAYCPLAPTEA